MDAPRQTKLGNDEAVDAVTVEAAIHQRNNH